MSDKDRSFSGSKFGKSILQNSAMSSKQLGSHIRSIMPSLRGGKKEDQIKYIRIRVQQNLQYQKKDFEETLKKEFLNQVCGEFYDYKKFKQTNELLKQEISEQDLFYIFLKEQIAPWGEKFSKQEYKQSDGKKTIVIVQFLRNKVYEKKVKQRNQMLKKNKIDAYEKIIYYINSQGEWFQQLQRGVFVDLQEKLKNKLLREGDRIKSWALANKFKQKKPKKQKLYIYIQDTVQGTLFQKLVGLYKHFKKKNGFKWTHIIPFKTFNEILLNIKQRKKDFQVQKNLVSQLSINPTSKIFDKSLSYVRSTSAIKDPSAGTSTLKSVKQLILDKNDTKLRSFDKNFIIHSYEFQEAETVYQFVMSQKDDNWQRVIYETKNYPQIQELAKQIGQRQQTNQQDQILKMINAKTLYIVTYSQDQETLNLYNDSPNIFNNRYLLDYSNRDQLLAILTNYARDQDNFTIVIFYSQNSLEVEIVKNFISKHQLVSDNICLKYRNKGNQMNQSLSMNSRLSNSLENTQIDKFLKGIMESRDQNFNPFNCYGDSYVYLLHRYDKEHLIDNDLRKKIAESARLKKSLYQDANYLHQMLKSFELRGDYAIVLTQDDSLRQAQQIAKKFDKASIMNITQRKKMKQQKKVLAWGTHKNIKQAISSITQKFRVLQRRKYQKDPNTQIFKQNSIPRRLPKYIDFKQGNNVTVKISSKLTNPDSQVTQDNLNVHFKQQIRIEQYKKPQQIRLVNKIQQPLTFIICRDDQKQLQYMQQVAKQQRDDLRQQYILYTEKDQQIEKAKNSYVQQLFNIQKYQRFRVITNSWRKIQQYIIGVVDMNKKDQDKNDEIYQDQLIYVFYHPQDIYLKQDFIKNYVNSPIYKKIRFYDISKLEWIALEQSPYHLYYVLVNQANTNFNSAQALKTIKQVQIHVQNRNVSPKRIMMLVMGKKAAVVKDTYTQGVFQNSQQVLIYISKTKLKQPEIGIIKPYIIIDKNSQDWYYFLDKNKDKNRYNYFYSDKIEQIAKYIGPIRQKQVGAQFWYITNNYKDFSKFIDITINIQKGNKIYGLYHGTAPASLVNKAKFQNTNRAQIQSFILNAHKRSHTIFSPESIRTKQPILAISKQNYKKIPIDPIQIQKWREDLQAKQLYYDKIQQIKNLPKDCNIYLITDYSQQQNYPQISSLPNVWRIIYDCNYSNDQKQNQSLRKKAHKLYKIYPKIRQLYYGFYPAQIRHFLRYLRYNIKNSQQKLKQNYKDQLINIFIQNNLSLDSQQFTKLYNNNHSIANIYSFENNKNQLQKCINYAVSNKGYGNLFILSKNLMTNLQQNQNQNKNIINYIVYDEQFRKLKGQAKQSQLLTDQLQQYVNYLFNLPQNRYESAKKFKSKDAMKLLYLNNGTLDNQIVELQKINTRNNNFNLDSYNDIKELNQFKQNAVILTQPNSYKTHIKQLGYRENFGYFILSNARDINLNVDKSKSQYFITKDYQQLKAYFNNLRRISSAPIPNKMPGLYEPILANNLKNLKLSRPLTFNSGIDLIKLKVLPPFKTKKLELNRRELPKNKFLDTPPQNLFKPQSNLKHDLPLRPISFQQMNQRFPLTNSKQLPSAPPMQDRIIMPLNLSLDYMPVLSQQKFNSRSDQISTIPKRVQKPGPKTISQKLALVYPQNRQFKQILKVLQSNLNPSSFTNVQGFSYMNEFDLQNLLKNQNKFLGYQRTVIFLNPKSNNNIEELKIIQNKLRGKLQIYTFNDDFHLVYPRFKQFLYPYTIRNNDIPYINKQDPIFWLQTNHYNIIVPINKKKYYNVLKSQNISVLPYNDDGDIESQLHRNNQFLIIVCDKKNYHELKSFTRISPRCIIIIQDIQQLKQDQIPLFRFAKKVLYYGPDAINYLKIRIPSKITKIIPQPMKVIFYKKDDPRQMQYVLQDQFTQYQKVYYTDAQDLFIKLIDKQFSHTANYKVPQSLKLADKVKLVPKIYLHKNSTYRNDHQLKKFISDYSKFSSIHQKQFRKSFHNVIKPQQYKHLPIVQFDQGKQLKQKLLADQTPSLVFLDINISQQTSIKQELSNRHLFIQMFDVYDIWIDRNGYLIPAQQLNRQQLAHKQSLFIDMFNMDVFNSYNDMGFYYLSNAFKVLQKKTRNITFMTREQLVQQYKNNPNLLMIIFVQHTDRKFIPQQFYDIKYDAPKEDRVKLIFIHTTYVHNQNILYIKYNQIDPVFYHINRVQDSSRSDYCIFPNNKAGNIHWHHFASKSKGFKPIQYNDINQMDSIAQTIKGSFKHVHVICDKQNEEFIRQVFEQYSIKNKPNTNQRLTFNYITQADLRSYIGTVNKSKIISTINFNPLDEKQKFQTVGYQVDIKQSSLNALYNSNINNNQPTLQNIVQSKNFIINLNQSLKDIFPVGNLYTNGVRHFKNLNQIDLINPLNQLIVTNQNIGDFKNVIQNNQKFYLVYVDNNMPVGQNGNSIVIKQEEIPKFITQLQNIQKGNKKIQNKYNMNNFINNQQNLQQQPSKNIQDFKVIKVFYDEGLDKQVKKQILLASLKNKNFRPYLFRDMDQLKKLMKQQDSLSLLLISKQPPNLAQQLQKQNYTILKNKRGRKLIVPKYFNPGIDGLSTILQQDQSDFQNINKQALNQHVDTYLTIMQKNPQKGRKNLLVIQQKTPIKSMNGQSQQFGTNQIQKQDSDKLNLHSNINIEGTYDLANKQWIRQRLDGGVIVLFIDKNQVQKVLQLKKKYNVLLQQYNHLINLNNSIREKKDKFTIVLVDPTMLNQVKNIKQQHPKTVFVLVNNDGRQIPSKDKTNISLQINSVQQIQPVIKDIYQQNQKIKYEDHVKIQSKIDNKRTSYVDNGNSWRLSTGYQNTRVKNIYIFYKDSQNQNLKKRVQHLSHVTLVGYKDFAQAEKKFNSHSGYQVVLIANDKDIPQFQDYITKKKQQTYIIKLNPPEDHQQNPKIRKNLLLSSYSQQQVSNFLIDKFGEHTVNRRQQKPKQGKSYAPRYQPNTFGTTPRFASQKDYVPYKNDPIYSSRGLKSSSRDSKMLRSDSNRDLASRNALSPYYNR